MKFQNPKSKTQIILRRAQDDAELRRSITSDAPHPKYPLARARIADRRGFLLMSTSSQRGQALFVGVAIVFLVLIVAAIGFGFLAVTRSQIARQGGSSELAFLAAEAGLEDAMVRVANGMNVPSAYTLTVGTGGTADVTVSGSGSTRTITSLGSVALGNQSIQRRLRTTMATGSATASFNFAALLGNGGLLMHNDAQIQGDAHANRSIYGEGSARILGDVSVAYSASSQNQAWEGYTSNYTFAQSNPVVDVAQRFIPSQTDAFASAELNMLKVGSPADITVRLVTDSGGEPSGTELQSVTLPAASVSTSLSWVMVSFGSTTTLTSGTPYWIVLDASRNSSNYYRWGSDSGNGYASGYGMYRQNWSGGSGWVAAGRDFQFRVSLGGVATELNGMDVWDTGYGASVKAYNVTNGSVISAHVDAQNLFADSTASGNVAADTIQNCTISGTARYNTKVSCTISGSETTPTTPPTAPTVLPMPVSDAQIAVWKAEAEAGGTIGDYSLGSGGSGSLGPVKIAGNLTLAADAVLTLTGVVWVTGNITMSSSTALQLAPSYGTLSGVLVVDGRITLASGIKVCGSEGYNVGAGACNAFNGSYLMLLDTNTSLDAMNPAIMASANSASAILYATQGLIVLSAGANLKQVTAYQLEMNAGSLVIYEAGLGSVEFNTGSASNWSITSWQEIL